MTATTLFEKLWQAHLVEADTDGLPAMLYIDLHLVHEVTSPQAFSLLRERGLRVRQPSRTLATLDHSTPTTPVRADGSRTYLDTATEQQVDALIRNCSDFGVSLHGYDSPDRGIVHVMAPELGATQPGMTIVCGDSHTSTHGAFGALAFGIGSTEVGHVLATQCLLQHKPKTMAVIVRGQLPVGISAKDLTLHIAGQVGVAGGTGHVIEFRGDAVRALTMEERMTLCNMSIEMGARAGLIGADGTTIEWLRGRRQVPQGDAFEAAAKHWRWYRSDDDARFDKTVEIDAGEVAPSVTWGIDPGKVIAIDAPLPALSASNARAFEYMRVTPGALITGVRVDVVFVGSCTNSRINDLRDAAAILAGRRVAAHVRMLVVPGSERIKREAEAEGLDAVFRTAGAEWREPGCSMCLGMNGDIAKPGELVVSTSNRNFEGRQGKGVRTVLASPATAAASAIAGVITDPRRYQQEAAA
ncbi:MAG: 3-isopropylmalate dehydratase large subunit [Rhodanobacteraceae bacterium]|nr:3-isopropylmalate dehydratase large subunit [Rhodanobacteraceae bacterium]MBP9153533.1 3-isopropylmalate dehydratase large subunit [Xanthomonadales bacterium]HQW81921.1 3-isopropylmalate dehydratase large subunit [Pseudomonadota bacterium]